MRPLRVLVFNLFIPLLIIPQVFKDLVFDFLLFLFELTFSLDLHQIMVFLFSLINYWVYHSWLEMSCLINQHYHLNNHVIFIINHLFQVNAFFINSYHSHLLIWVELLTVKFLFNHLVAKFLQRGIALGSFILNSQFIPLIINRWKNY